MYSIRFYSEIVQALDEMNAPYMIVGAFAGLALKQLKPGNPRLSEPGRQLPVETLNLKTAKADYWRTSC